jgi:GTPase SAR1 family protein
MATHEQLTAVQVIQMFEGLRLPVTDDAQQIIAKYQELNTHYLRQKNSTDGQKRVQADQWFKHASLLKLEAERKRMLEIVKKQFEQLANTVLQDRLAQGIQHLTAHLHRQLEELALTQYKCDAPLARRFVEEYLAQHNIKSIGDPLVIPRFVQALAVASRSGRVDLQWQLPAAECDEVVIRRVDLDEARGSSVNELGRGRCDSWSDLSVAAGTRYRYEVYSIWQGVPSVDAPFVETMGIGEIEDAQIRWTGDHVTIKWQKPTPNCRVYLFRGPTAGARSPAPPPVMRSATPEPTAPSPDTELLYRGPDSEWHDRTAAEGVGYRYMLVAWFAPGYYSDGVSRSIVTPSAPPAVASLDTAYEFHQGRGAVALKWEPVQTSRRAERVDYIVTRLAGSVAPTSVRAGVVVATVHQTSWLDDTVEPGQRYAYAVFSLVGEMPSRKGAASRAVDIVADVDSCRATGGDGWVEIEWQAPDAARVTVERCVVGASTGVPLDESAFRVHRAANKRLTGKVVDTGVRNGQRYDYLVRCAYRPDGVNLAQSRGVTVSAVPAAAPAPIADFRVVTGALGVVCTWTPPPHGAVVVIRSPAPLRVKRGALLPAGDVALLGQEIPVRTAGRAEDTAPTDAQPHYTVVSLQGAQAMVGETGYAIACPDVTRLRVVPTRSGVELRWDWPSNCRTVYVLRRCDAWPTDPSDSGATRVMCTLTEYGDAGGKWADPLEAPGGRFYYVVYAQSSAGSGRFFSSGTGSGCRAAIDWAPMTTLRYRVDPQAGQLALTWTIEHAGPAFSGFALVANRERPPIHAQDGIPLFRSSAPDCTSGAHEARINLAPVQERGWGDFFAKAVVVDPAERGTTFIVHPDTSRALSSRGAPAAPDAGRPPRVYRAGTPKRVTCPQCFDQFPVGKMLFTSFAGGDVLPGRYSWWHRLLGKPPEPPRNAHNQQFSRKLCPSRHVLPFTAGAQDSLVIGLIGAKSSGKTHFISALVERLSGRAGADLRAALLPASGETEERYRQEFYKPLFEDRLELPLTVGVPPPLIYDWRVDGALWSDPSKPGPERPRAVTLALYDTAGENLESAEVARQMLDYLRVASGIVFLVDPLQVPEVRDKLSALGVMAAPDLDPKAEPHAILARVLHLLQDGNVLRESAPLDTPVAVVLTKCDLLRDAGLIDRDAGFIEPNRLWSENARHVGWFDWDLHEDTAGMMSELVRRWEPSLYENVSRRFSRRAFFGASATGCSSDKRTGRFHFVSPWRVEDPLLWLLAELEVIPSKKPDRAERRS